MCCCGGPKSPADNFPQDIECKQLRYQSFDFTMSADYIWNVIPKNSEELLAVVNWAAEEKWIVRIVGGQFTWYPGLVCDLKTANQKLLLVDLKPHFGAVEEPNVEAKTVRTGAGALMGNILNKLTANKLVLSSYPADGHLTIGGVVTAGSHGSICTDAPGTGSNPHGSLANMVVDFEAIVYDEASKQYVSRSFKSDSQEGRAYLVSMGRIIITHVTLRAMQNYFCRCITDVKKDFEQVFQKPTAENPRPKGSFADIALSSGRYSALSMPLTNTVWHRNVFPCEENPKTEDGKDIKKITAPYSFPYMANLPLWQQSVAQTFSGVPTDGLLTVLADHFGPESHEGVTEKIARDIDGAVQRFSDAFGVTDLLQRTSKSTSYLTQATVELGNWMNDLGDTWGESQNLLLCVENTLRMRSFGVVIVTSKDKLQACAAAAMNIIHTSLDEEGKKGNYPVALPVEFRASALDDDVNGGKGAPMLSFIRKDERATKNGWDIAIAIEVVHFPKTYGVNSYMTKLEAALVAAPELSGDNARVVPNWGKSYAYTREGPWHSQKRMDVVRQDNAEWNTALDLIEKADPKGVTNNTISQYVLARPGQAPEQTRLPWDTKFGEDEPGCGTACCRFWCCCCTD